MELQPGQRVSVDGDQMDKLRCAFSRERSLAFLFTWIPFLSINTFPLSHLPDPFFLPTDDLKIVNNNVAMLTDMLGALGPDERVSDADVIGELHQACNEMRSRILSLIDSVSNDDLLGCASRHPRNSVANSPRPTSQTHPTPFPSSRTASFLLPMMP